MNKFAHICPKCGKVSNSEDAECEYCGALKSENILGTNIENSIEEDVSSALNLNNNGKIIFSVFYRIIIMAFFIFLIPQFVKDSFIYIFLVSYFTILHVLKDFINYKIGSIFFSIIKYLGIFYLIAGIGNLIFSTGLNKFTDLGNYFELKNILGFSSNHSLLIIFTLIFTMLFLKFFSYYYRVTFSKD